jgi:glycerol-3-phosphate dehydrogenase
VPSGAQDESDDSAVDFSCLSGQRIGIYTLEERAANSARAHIERVAHGIDVRLNHDLKATQSLKELARNCDILLVVTASATHTATDAIKAARKQARTESVNSSGASAIIDALSRLCAVEDIAA